MQRKMRVMYVASAKENILDTARRFRLSSRACVRIGDDVVLWLLRLVTLGFASVGDLSRPEILNEWNEIRKLVSQYDLRC